jgi:mannose/fructose/N-acetylgalactosamine-specific phosphotransferase system component IIC
MSSLLVVSLLGGALITEEKSSVGLMLSSPICAGLLVGLVMGKPSEGFFAGALFQMIFMGYVPVRGERSMSVGAASIAGVAIYLLGCRTTGNDSSFQQDILFLSILMGVLISGTGDFCYITRENSFWSISRSATGHATAGNYSKASWWHMGGLFADFFSGFLFILATVALGRYVVSTAAGFMDSLSGNMMPSLKVLIPFIGVAALMRIHIFSSKVIWFGAGFIVTVVFFLIRGLL